MRSVAHQPFRARCCRESADIGEGFVYDPTDPNLALPPLSPGDFRANPTLGEVSSRVGINFGVTRRPSVHVPFTVGYTDTKIDQREVIDGWLIGHTAICGVSA